MRRRTHVVIASTAVTLLSTGLPAASAPAVAVGGSSDLAHTVTLLSGDQVQLSAPGARPVVRAAAGREGVAFRVFTENGHLHVIPADAQGLLSAGRLDPRLFDVTGLLDQGYDNRRGDLPLIATGPAPRAAMAGVRATRDLPAVGARALSAEKSALAGSWHALASTGKVWLDGKVTAGLDRSAAQIGAPQAWQAGVTGRGVTVAVLDTGVDQTHPDLAGQEIGEHNFTDSADNVDRVGHGTHVASIIAGTGAKYRGIASGARILDGKVLDDHGYGLQSWIVAGMEWATAQGADVVNLSLGGADTPGIDPVEEAVNRLSASTGKLFVVAAGNNGAARTIDSPGSADAALTVGSVGREDKLSSFSSRGPRIDGALKPDITAPGENIVAAKAAQATIGDPAEDGYIALSGTSMATPHVTGSAALLKQRHPDWTGQQLKAALTASARPAPGLDGFAQGAGRVDVSAALAATVTTEPASVSVPTARWPHTDDTPVARAITYCNSGTAPVTLTLTADVLGPDGKPAPAGLFTVSPARLTVPPGGTAAATATVDTRVGTADGLFGGAIVATGGGQTTRTAIGVDREVESYSVKVTLIGLDGKPTANAGANLFNYDGVGVYSGGDPTGVFTLRLPRGKYEFDAFLVDSPTNTVQTVVYPALDLTADTEIVADSRTAKPIDVRPPDAGATQVGGTVGLTGKTARGDYGTYTTVDDFSRIRTARIGPNPQNPPAASFVEGTYTSDKGFYDLFYAFPGDYPTGLTRHPRATDIATVKTTFANAAPDSSPSVSPYASVPGVVSSGVQTVVPAAVTGTTQFANTDGGVLWATYAYLGGRLPREYWTPLLKLTPGTTTQRRMNAGIVGPTAQSGPRFGITRSQGTLLVYPGLFGDGAGNWGSSDYTGATTLSKDGTRIGENPGGGLSRFPVGDGSGTYTVAATADRDRGYDLATHVDATWTFRSGPDNEAVPVSAVRFKGVLDAADTAPAGRYYLPVTLEKETGQVELPRTLTVEVSYDEGKTWAAAPVVAKSLVVLDHPKGAGSVSLRAAAEDSRGSTVKQTVIRAYKLR
ncbi:S8 family serine peptidase [Actinokineospora auranticolor]|uniref:Subtilase family protein n=1 Tax=Actinokineospora auranticolor TaxID=155976 RepID=A0A2S6GF08_9PSEU|nr:S8 family serine peptidase [Actinokineospora auranticolor]PPK63814.1 subtilase family protein [Actinokineospora auranticolor]